MKEIKKAKVEDYGYDGEGVARGDGKVVFLPFALIGEEVEFESGDEKSSFIRGKVTKICKQNPNRIEPPCQYFGKCGGCSLQHACYDHELEIKKQLLKAQLRKTKFQGEIEVFASPKEFEYRNKIRLFVGRDGLSLKERASSKLVPINKCLLVKDKINTAIENINIFIKTQNLYKQYREVVIREEGDKVLINFVLTRPSKVNYQGLYLIIGNCCGIFETLNKKTVHKIGLKSLESVELGVKATFSVNSFHQVNPFLMEQLYKKVIENVEGKTVVNCYSGAGVLSGVLAKSCQNVVGIELGKSEHEDSEHLKSENRLNNLINICGDCGQVLAKNHFNADTIVVDPPRAGMSVDVCEAIDRLNAKRLIYVSCDSATMVRDLTRMKNYQLKKAFLFDMFAKTGEYESLCVLDRL